MYAGVSPNKFNVVYKHKDGSRGAVMNAAVAQERGQWFKIR